MSNTQHTPGPWIVIDQPHPYKDGSKSHIERGIYTQRIHPQLKDHWPVVCMSIGVGMDGAPAIPFVHIDEADARLIAAAPELLEALQLALSAHGKLLLSDPPQEAWKTYGVEAKARAAIVKATGGEV